MRQRSNLDMFEAMAGNLAGGINAAADPPPLQTLPAAIAADYRELPFYLPLTYH